MWVESLDFELLVCSAQQGAHGLGQQVGTAHAHPPSGSRAPESPHSSCTSPLSLLNPPPKKTDLPKPNAYLCYCTETQMVPQTCCSELILWSSSLLFSFYLVTKQEIAHYFSQMAAKLHLRGGKKKNCLYCK